jgi:iron complex transport system ATP-binding protein
MLARALAQEPRFLLLDEPTANLDIAHQVRTLELIRSLARTRNLAALVVTHEINLASEFADRVLLMRDGESFAIGTPTEVVTRARVEELFETRVLVDANPFSGAPRVTLMSHESKGEGIQPIA